MIKRTQNMDQCQTYNGFLSFVVPDDYPLVLGCEEHVSSLLVFVA